MSTVRRLLVITALTATAALVTTGCLSPSRVAPAPLSGPVAAGPPSLTAAPAPATPPDIAFVIPPGTYAAGMRGEPAFEIPSHIRVVTGQSISIRNEDQAMHYFFDVPIAPGQTFRKTFNRIGSFGYSLTLSCSLAKGGSVTVEVSPP